MTGNTYGATKNKLADFAQSLGGLSTNKRMLLLCLPAIIFLLIFFIYPLIRLLYLSFFDPQFTLEHYSRVFTEGVYLRVLVNTLNISAQITFFCLLLAYPVSALITSVGSKIGNRLMILVLLPFWTSVLIRAYSWIVILQRRGIVNEFLMDLGLVEQPLSLMFNRFGLLVGTVHVLLPFMIFPLIANMSGIDKNLLKAAQNLGAHPVKSFLRIFLPLSFPGAAAGSLIVFVMCLGFFVTPALMGGRGDIMISVLIESQVREFLNWGFGSALSFVLLAITLLIYGVAAKWFGLSNIWGGKQI